MGLTKAAITRPVFILMLMVIAIMLGFLSYSKMRKEQSPDVSFGVVTVVTPYPGASPDEVNTLVSRKIEDAISGVNGLREVTSTSDEGLSVVVAQLEIGANVDSAISDVRSKVDSIVNSLPTDTLKPSVSKVDTTSTPILSMVASSTTLTNKQIRDIADDKLSDIFGQINGVASVFVNGGDVRELQVRLKKDKLLAYGLGISQIQQAVFGATQNVPSGHVVNGNQQYNVRVLGEFKTPADLANVVLSIPDTSSPGNPPRTVKLRDIADVVDSIAERQSYTRLNGRDAITISVQKSREANSVEISQAAAQAIKQIKKTYNIDIVKTFEDAKQIQDSLADLNFALFFGVFLVATIIFIFLHNMRGTIIVSIAIPVCLIASFIAMSLLGFTINSMSMLALSLAIGVLVDDAIVVLENIYRHLQMGEDPREAAINGRSEIGLAAIAISLADVVVFTPIGMMGGILGGFFKPLGLTFAAVVLISLFVSFTVTPMLASRWYRAGEDMEHPKGWFSRGFERAFLGLQNFYRRVLDWSLIHRWFVFVSGFVVLLGIIMLILGSFMPDAKSIFDSKSPVIIMVLLAVFVGFIAFGINYWPKVLDYSARKWFIWGVIPVAIGMAVAMHLHMMGPIILFFGVLGFIGVLYGLAGVVAFIANLFVTRFKSRFIFAALAFGLVFPAFALLGNSWAHWKKEAVFKGAFFPPTDNGLISVNVELPPDASLAATQRVVSYLEKICMADPDVKFTLAQVGSGAGGGFSGSSAIGANRAAMNLTLYDKESFMDHFSSHTEKLRTKADTDVAAGLLQKIGKIPGANLTVSASANGFGLPIQMSLVGPDRAQLVATAVKIVDGLKKGAVPGVVSPDLSSKPGVPELWVNPDRQKLAENNLTVAQLGAATRIMYQGNNDTKFRVNGREYDIRVMLDYADRNNPNILSELPIAFGAGGVPIYLANLAKVNRGVGVDVIQRRQRQDQVIVTADLLPGYAAGNVQPQIDNWIKTNHLFPEGVSVLPGGQADFMAREGPNLFIAFGLGLVLVYMLLASLFDNILYPFVIQLAQPQAMVGALLALMILDQPLNIVGMIGIITLVGLVGKNAILVVDYTNTLRGRGRNRHDAILEAGPTRLRPIMMTTGALILGILPVAMAIGRGSEFRQTIGTTIIGGMTLSTLLTLVVIPCSYTIFDDFSLYLGKIFKRGGTTPKSGQSEDDLMLVTERVPLGL